MPSLSQEFKFREVFNLRVVTRLAEDLTLQWPDFPADRFIAQATADLDDLGMNERSAQITDALTDCLPEDFPTAVTILVGALGQEQPEPGKTDWDGFIVLPQCGWIARHGQDHFDLSMQALYRMTQRFSAEAHLRIFLELDPERCLETLRLWTEDEDPHVRRLVSEGTRPRLPMTGRIQRFIDDPRPVFDLLERLREDPSLYVRRSVANNLNDISKDNPELVLDLLERWNVSRSAVSPSAVSPSAETRWIVRHASRSLVKEGHPRAMALFGFTPNPSLRVHLEISSDGVAVGEELHFVTQITSTSDQEQKLLLDYVVHFLKANGRRKPKVFKWTERQFEPGETLRLERRQHFRPTSGRKLYPGAHALALKINGIEHPEVSFELR